MPIYGYACDACQHSFQALQKMSDPKLLDCPECGEARLQKQLSAPKFRLAGKGWYETDFKTGDKRNLAGDSESKPSGKDNDGAKNDGAKKEAAKKDTPKKDAKKDVKKATKESTRSKSSSSDSKASSA